MLTERAHAEHASVRTLALADSLPMDVGRELLASSKLPSLLSLRTHDPDLIGVRVIRTVSLLVDLEHRLSIAHDLALAAHTPEELRLVLDPFNLFEGSGSRLADALAFYLPCATQIDPRIIRMTVEAPAARIALTRDPQGAMSEIEVLAVSSGSRWGIFDGLRACASNAVTRVTMPGLPGTDANELQAACAHFERASIVYTGVWPPMNA